MPARHRQHVIPLAIAGLLACFVSGAPAQDSEPARDDAESRPASVPPMAADADAPLPADFPDATAPEVIEVKTYPAYRSAIARGKNLSAGAGDTLFFSLFNHISSRGVEMTAPVINTYESAEMVVDPKKLGDVSMEFLYQQPDQGEVGPGAGIVQVEDHPAVTVVSLGLQGNMSNDRMQSGVETLREWIGAHADEWKVAGPPRRLGYHGPMTPTARRLWEIQIPITKVEKNDVAPAADAISTDKP